MSNNLTEILGNPEEYVAGFIIYLLIFFALLSVFGLIVRWRK